MEYAGRWVYQQDEVPHAFSLCRVLDAGTPDQSYDLLGAVRVTVDRLHPERLPAALRPWALATIANGGYGFGRFYASYGTLDEEGEPDRALADEYIDWSGTEVLVPQPPQPQPQP
ncbi:hypothetical protein [Micromonospora sp. WMMD1082]|uniref:hypothetical protein n=1 Tax=Micromonospora sp. WMMD1082 TaxID=3016104 RepID=UPI0024168494|nr:hypothetical protein [Micromonospora sp. WMMD1082]MDG4794508.1 hypothetical protein [Micromonospora sp. WMMD1082]